jgi:hypothetical protein
LLETISHRAEVVRQERCPRTAQKQCFTVEHEHFEAEAEVVARVARHIDHLKSRGVAIRDVLVEVLCVRQLNDERAMGVNRFMSDLHAMEALILALRARAGSDIEATCGKIGGITDYDKYFGPLSGRLRICLEQARPRSSYRVLGVGEVHFVQDADASDPLVMLASMIGKYVRELMMARISRYYFARSEQDCSEPVGACSGYHDPVTARFIQLTREHRSRARIPVSCFEREGLA